jgi:hypothetical protein
VSDITVEGNVSCNRKKSGKVHIFTILPMSCSVRKIQQEFMPGTKDYFLSSEGKKVPQK